MRILLSPWPSGLPRWFYAQRSTSSTITKDLTVRFNSNGTVKSYSFTSNFPEDMRKFR